jgi:hypothetical protein
LISLWGGAGVFLAETDSKQTKIHRKTLKYIFESKVWRLLPNVCDFQKTHTLGCGFKNL